VLSGRGLKAGSAIPDVDFRLRGEPDSASTLDSDEIESVVAPVAMPARNWRRFMDDKFMAFLITFLGIICVLINPYVQSSELLIVNF